VDVWGFRCRLEKKAPEATAVQLETVIEINFSTIDRMKLAVMYRLHTSLTDTKLEIYHAKVNRLDLIIMVITVT